MRALVLVVLLAACGDDHAIPPEDVGGCDGIVESVPDEQGDHVPVGSRIEWSSNPPAIGAHYPQWAAWDRHYAGLQRAYYVHNLEHGGIVLLYNCPNGCPDVVESLIDVVRTAKVDTTCEGVVKNRMIVVQDPMMPAEVQVAAVAWGQVYTASCFDPYVARFARTRYRRAPEDFCDDGVPMGGALISFP